MNKVSEGVFDWQGQAVRYAEAGSGPAVVIVAAGPGTAFDDLATTLAERHRVLVIDASPLQRGSAIEGAAFLNQAVARLDVPSFSVIGKGSSATLALALAVFSPASVQRVVLLAPTLAAVQHPDIGERLREITMPTLVLVGTRDRSGARAAGQVCRAHIPASHLVLVYEAGPNLLADRREACLAPINEFLDRGEGFIVFQESQLIRP